jgi:thioredoxin reductase
VLDVVIVGGGPAGLTAALVLGRCRRRVLICDNGRPRNAASRALHGYLTRDGIAPSELLRLGRDELGPYDIAIRQVTVVDVQRIPEGFSVTLESGEAVIARVVLLATGVRDHLPQVEGIDACLGISAFHCPYCDGWEVRDRRLVVIGVRGGATSLALALKTWSNHVTICSNGPAHLAGRHREQLAAQHIEVHQAQIVRLDHDRGQARQIMLQDGASVPCDAVFFATGQSPHCDLPRRLGCEFTRRGTVKTDRLGHTRVPGLYVVGDASRDVQFVVVAASEGAKAAVAINKALQQRAGLAAAPIP